MASMTPQQLVQAVRSKDPMRGLCESKQISPEGCDWLKFALDPFHDLQLDNLRGYPDVATEPTVVVKVRQALEISAPAAIRSSGGNWDCHIVLSPIDWAKPNVKLASVNNRDGYNVTGTFQPMGDPTAGGLQTAAGLVRHAGHTAGSGDDNPGLLGRVDGLVVNSVPATPANGGDMTYTPGHMPLVEDATGYKLDQINLDNYLDFDETDLGSYRLVYSGFEVVNTTAQIYKQGAVTVYEYGHSYETSQAVTRWATSEPDPEHGQGYQTVGTNTFRCPPNTIAEAKIMPGSHTWPAQEGCYCTAKFQTDNPFQTPTQRNYVIAQNLTNAPSAGGYGGYGSGPSGGSILSPGLVGPFHSSVGVKGDAALGAFNAAPATHFSRMSTCGAYFTGLSPQSTLFITWRVGIERLPAANKPTFLALAQPSAVFDPNALALYNLIANHLPPGCPQGWNDLGRWFRTIADVAQDVIPAAFPLVGTAQMILRSMGPRGAIAASALPVVAEAAMAGVKAAKQRKQNAQNKAAAKLQAAVRNKKKQKAAVQNFGEPGQRGARKVQSFSQMA